MINKLRKQFVMIAMASITFVLVLLIAIIDIFAYVDTNKNLDTRLQILYDNDGNFPQDFKDFRNNMDLNPQSEKKQAPPNKDVDYNLFELFNSRISDETPFDTRFFTVRIDSNGNVLFVNTGKIAAVSSSDATAYAKEIYRRNLKKGFYRNYKFLQKNDEDSTLFIFVNCENEVRTLGMLILASILVLLIGVFLVFILVRILTRLAIKPVEESYAKQKRFITDASHEIKTPLAIIDANMEVIEMDAGQSQWTQSTKKQIKRLTDLTKKLIMLSRMDEEEYIVEKTEFSLNEALELTIEAYEAALGNRNIKTDISVINYNGNQENILQVFGLLMDNAIKYSKDDSLIKINCYKKGKNIVIEFYNEVEEIQKGNLDILFERFYRSDESRNSMNSGFGIGLSVVKAIIENHNGHIHCVSEDGKSIKFIITLYQ